MAAQGETQTVVQRARSNRANMPNAERRMWSLLRDRRLAYKFRRQHPIGIYAVDFACPAIHLVVEIDGASHERKVQQDFDSDREAYLINRGWRILRVPNDHVYQSIGEVEAAIRAILEPERWPPHPAAARPPSPPQEEKG